MEVNMCMFGESNELVFVKEHKKFLEKECERLQKENEKLLYRLQNSSSVYYEDIISSLRVENNELKKRLYRSDPNYFDCKNYKPKHEEHFESMKEEYQEWLGNGKKPSKTQMHDDFRALIEKYAKAGVKIKSVDANFIVHNHVGFKRPIVEVNTVEINSES